MFILISGITGMCGKGCALAALDAGHRVRGLGRNPQNLDAEISNKLEGFVKLESIYDLAALDKAVQGVDAIISAVVPTPEAILEGQLLLLRAAERAGVKVSEEF
jgi:nucleoside-diphosphate-sugar epimerase